MRPIIISDIDRIVNLFLVVVKDNWCLTFQFLEEIPLTAFHLLIRRDLVMLATV